jgi:prepilin-type processing-associated H-X9-DG protein
MMMNNKRGFTLVEAVIVAVVITVMLAVTLPWLRERERQPCADNLRQLAVVLRIFAGDSQDSRNPSLDPNRLMMSKDDIYPEYLNDLNLLRCPSDARAPSTASPQWYFDHSSYWYLAHMLPNEEEGLVYIEACRKIIEEGDGNLDADIVAPGLPKGKIYKSSLARRGGFVAYADAAAHADSLARVPSRIPVLIEFSDRHGSAGGHVLYMDGHAEYIEYPGKFPMTKAFIEGLKSLEALDVSR